MNPFRRSIRHLRCGDRVREQDGRHVAVVRFIVSANGVALFATLEWEDNGWRSENVDVRSLEYDT